jgi:Tol biopolymer transport system component
MQPWAIICLSTALFSGCADAPTAASMGSLAISSVTAGDSVDTNGYTLVLDDDQGHLLQSNGTLAFSNLAEGEHRIALGGIAPNCSVAGSNPRKVAIIPGDATQVTFEVACQAPPGSLQITISTTGEQVDPDGYSISVPGRAAQAVGNNGSISWNGVSTGDYQLLIGGIAPNCSLEGGNPRRISVGSDPVEVSLQVSCHGPAGTLVISVTTTGARPDPDGYLLRLDSGAEQQVPGNSTTTLRSVSAGAHQVELTGIAANCDLQGTGSRAVSIADATSSEVVFQVGCHSDDSGVLLFTSDRRGDTHIYRTDPDGSRVRNLTPDAEASNGDWSPDGKQIVFQSERDGAAAVYVMNSDGSQTRRLTAGGSPVWSPAGRQILFLKNGNMTVMEADGSNLRTLGVGLSPTWSPDGSRVAFAIVDQSRCVVDFFCPGEIWVMAADGSERRRLTVSTQASDRTGAPSWSPDGTTIAYTRTCCFLGTNENGLWLISADGGVPRRVDSRRVVGRPVWSPNGSSIALAVALLNESTEMTVIPSTGGAGVMLASSPGSEYPTSWK